jgi:hypothetical protein
MRVALRRTPAGFVDQLAWAESPFWVAVRDALEAIAEPVGEDFVTRA